MIQGLKPTVPGVKLLELLKQQIAFHLSRAEFYSNEAKRLAGLALDASTMAAKYSSIRDPREQLEEKVREHTQAAAKLEFIAIYLDVGETYQLTDSDLHAIGVGHRRNFESPPF